MATPNYSYEKRQKELAKKRKKEDKLKQKTERKSSDSDPTAEFSQVNESAPPPVISRPPGT
ncbi:MAG: hypothetical protein EBQ82_05745 [Betaproteobacteria bacterium]|nr:hypothetical protein [Betaproteobacteria bacterium]NBY04888.1 hypothetical protein [Betaproteobacteria bacterium]